MPELDLSHAREALVAAGITGPHQSHTRANNLAKIHSMLDSDVEGRFGLSNIQHHFAQEILDWLAALTGCSDDLTDQSGCDTIDPSRTVAAIAAAAGRLSEQAAGGATLLCTTGHPTGLLEHHIRVVDAYRRAGGKVTLPLEEERLALGKGYSEIRYVGGVGMLADWGQLRHTHSSAAMEAALEVEPRPDIVIGDHGFAGAAIERGIPTIAVMDINDPALAAAWGTGAEVVIIPMDDNRPPRLYEASWGIFERILDGA